MIQLKKKYKSFLEEMSLLHVYVSMFKHTLNVKRG